mmetsp:Transcript_40138/g.35429  ORF Transcript_40138/g.35429 Transcript_40138/m.35429 type:complete len:587 (+) Transcript_40138:89-1849(+)
MLVLLLISSIFIAANGKTCKPLKKPPKGSPDPCVSFKMDDCLKQSSKCFWDGLFKMTRPPFAVEGYPDKTKEKKSNKRKKRPEEEVVITANDKKLLDKKKFGVDQMIVLDAKTGKAREYVVNPTIVKGKSNKDFETLAQAAVKIATAMTKRSTDRSGRRLESEFDEDELFAELLNDRRRLSRDAEVLTGNGNIGNMAYCAAGYMDYYSYFKNDDAWFECEGSGVLAASTVEDGQKYDYVLTAGHIVYKYNIGTQQENDDVTNAKHYKRKINFHRAMNGNYNWKNGYWNLNKVWIGGGYKAGGKQEFDWAMLKYETLDDNSACAASFKSPANNMVSMKLIGYRPSDGTGIQSYNTRVVPEDLTDNWLYTVDPYYTEHGVSGSPLFETGTNDVVAVHTGNNGEDGNAKRSVHVRLTAAKTIVMSMIVTNNWNEFAESAFNDWQNAPGHARYIGNGDTLMNEGYVAHHHKKSLHRKESGSESALDLNIPNHDVNVHHYYHHEHEYDHKYGHDTYSDGYSEYDYNYEQTKLLLAIPIGLLTICLVFIGCLCCAGFGGIAGWFIKHTSNGSVKNRKNDYIQALNDNEVSEI